MVGNQPKVSLNEIDRHSFPELATLFSLLVEHLQKRQKKEVAGDRGSSEKKTEGKQADEEEDDDEERTKERRWS